MLHTEKASFLVCSPAMLGIMAEDRATVASSPGPSQFFKITVEKIGEPGDETRATV